MLKSTEPIIIPLEKSTNATKDFTLNNLIQLRSFDKISSIINENLLKIDENIKKEISCEDEDRYHEAITLLGNRGSGKTSFLLNLESYIKEKEKKGEINSLDLCFLKILDPTLFENKQNTVLTIITIILNHIKKKEEVDLVDEKYKDNFEKSLKSLASGLNLLDGINSNVEHKSIWDDDVINFNKGLQCSKDSIEFELLLRKFIRISLKYLKQKMFILMFDDIDTNVSKGWPVLEVIRKYLTMLEVQVIVSGDWNLFSKLVRVKQLENLDGIRNIENDYISIVDTLEEQYLTKILKPENRIMLQDLDTISKHQDIFVSYLDETPIPIQNVYREIIKYLFNTSDNASQDYLQDIFFSIPLRSNIFLMNSFYKNLKNENKFNFLNSLSKQFLTHLSKFNITFKDLNDLEEDTAIYSYIKKVKEISKEYGIDLSDFLNLSKINLSHEVDKNILFFILKGYLTVVIESKPYLLIEWLYKVELFILIKKNYISLEDDMEYLGYSSNISPLEYPVKLNGYMSFQEDEQSFTIPKELVGFVGVYKDKSKMRDKSYDYFTEQVLQLQDKESYSLLSLFLFNQIISARGSRFHLFGSLYFIIGLIFDLMKLKSKNQDILNYFQNKAVLTSIEPYNISKNVNTPINYHQSLSYLDLSNAQIVKDLDNWLGEMDLNSFSLNILSDIMKEYYFQLTDMPNCKSFGEYLTFNICYFLNAILKAETNYYASSYIPISRIKKNYSDAVDSLQTNISKSKIKSYSNSKNTLFKFFYDCPIWNYLISLHGISTKENNKESENTKTNILTPDLFNFNQVEDQEYVESEVDKEEIINPYYELLKGLKIHQGKEHDDEEEDIVENTILYETIFSIEKFLEIIYENKQDLNKYKVSDENQITSSIMDKYINVIKNRYKPGSKFRYSDREEMLKKAISKFSKDSYN